MNCGPLSDDISRGMPKRAIYCDIKACVQLAEVVSLKGMAFGQRKNRSMMVNR